MTTPAPRERATRLSSAQQFVLRDMQDVTSRTWLLGRYAQSLYALQRKDLIAFDDKRGKYELTPAGLAALGGAL